MSFQSPEHVENDQEFLALSMTEDGSRKSEKPPWGWDYAFIFEKDIGSEVADEKVEIIARLKRAGFVFSQIASESENIAILRFSLPPNKLKEKAEYIGLDVELLAEYGSGHMDFTQKHAQYFVNAEMESDTGSYFSPSDRIIIILQTLQSRETWGCALNIDRLIYSKVLKQAFAIHSPKFQTDLVKISVWDEMWNPFWIPPYRKLKDYLGARVGFYFSFVSLLARYLLPIGVISIIVFTVKRIFIDRVRVQDSLSWIYGIMIVIWSVIFLEVLKRRTAELVLDWGTYNYYNDIADEIRADFKGLMKPGFYSPGGFVSLEDIVEHAALDNDSYDRERLIDFIRGSFLRGIFREDDYLEDKKNDKVKIPVNAYDDKSLSRKFRLFSVFLTFVFICIVAGITFLLLWFRNEIICGVQGFTSAECKCYFSVDCEVPDDDSFFSDMSFIANAFPGILNGIVITIFDTVWPMMTARLTDRENHRTTQSYENSYVYKFFAFQFFSNYASLYYIAFISRRRTDNNICRLRMNNISGLREPDCMRELEMQMISLLLTKTIIQQVMEVGVPFLTSLFKMWRLRKNSEKDQKVVHVAASDRSRYVKETKMPPYPDTVRDYSEMVLQFGYLVLFGVSFPLSAVIMLVNTIIEVRTDAFKILKVYQRVNADRAADIGAWYVILRLLVFLGIITNSALLVFTAGTGKSLFGNGKEISNELKTLSFFLLMNSLFVLRKLIEISIGDVPSRTKRKLARQKFDVARHFDIGWEKAFQGNALFHIDDEAIKECQDFNEKYDPVSDDETDVILGEVFVQKEVPEDIHEVPRGVDDGNVLVNAEGIQKGQDTAF